MARKVEMAAARDRKGMLLETGLILGSQLSLPVVLQRIVELAVQITGARYGALGVLGGDGRISDFLTTGLSRGQRQAIGSLPKGKGILGALISDPRPLRLRLIADDGRSVGFPAKHPPMSSFLGAPVKALDRVYGIIYLTDKQAANEFSVEDEEDLVVLATQAGVAIANAHLYEESRRHQAWLGALREIATAILGGSPLNELLGMIARFARELVDADLAMIASPEAETGQLAVTAADGKYAADLLGMAVPAGDSISGDVIRTGEPLALDDASADERAYQPMVRKGRMGPTVFVPLKLRGTSFGTLAVSNAVGGRRFDEAAVDLVETFADQASVALEYGRAQRELQRLAIMDERERIAKELHDGIIQSLFAVGMGLQGTATMIGSEAASNRIDGAVDEIDRAIRDLRNYIFGLRPGILADRHLDQALQELALDLQERSGVATETQVDPAVAAELASRSGDIVQLAREALSNVGRHAGAGRASLSLQRRGGTAVLRIADDGRGFDSKQPSGGQGLGNLRSRATALGGTARIRSSPGRGTTVEVRVPL